MKQKISQRGVKPNDNIFPFTDDAVIILLDLTQSK